MDLLCGTPQEIHVTHSPVASRIRKQNQNRLEQSKNPTEIQLESSIKNLEISSRNHFYLGAVGDIRGMVI